jgi:hypothetical protein
LTIFAILEVLPEAVLLSTFPFAFYSFTRPIPASPVRYLIVLACIGCYVLVCAMYFLFWFGGGMSGGGAGPYPLNRLLQLPIVAGFLALALPAGAMGLAVARVGTLGLWVFAIGAGFTSYVAGRGWLPAEMDWRFVAAFAALGGLCGLAAGLVLSRTSRPQGRAGKALAWGAVGAASAAVGMLASRPGVERAVNWTQSRQPSDIELTPFSIDPWVMVPVLIAVVAAWLVFSAIAAIATGYVRLGRGLPARSVAPEEI